MFDIEAIRAKARATAEAQRERLDKAREAALPKGWTRLPDRAGKPHYRTTNAVSKPKASDPAPEGKKKVLAFRLEQLVPGGDCPKCVGGVYTYLDGRVGKCNTCDGRSYIIANDLAEVARRLRTGLKINWILTRELQPAFN